MAHIELNSHERHVIEEMLHAKASVSAIAEKLSRHRSTIHREIGRNIYTDDEMPELNGCYGKIAQRSPPGVVTVAVNWCAGRRRPSQPGQADRSLLPRRHEGRPEGKGRLCHLWWKRGERPPGRQDRRYQ